MSFDRFMFWSIKLNLDFVLVISNDDFGYKTWLWIPLSKILELNLETHESGKSGEEFFPIPADEFIQISYNEPIEKLFIKRF